MNTAHIASIQCFEGARVTRRRERDQRPVRILNRIDWLHSDSLSGAGRLRFEFAATGHSDVAGPLLGSESNNFCKSFTHKQLSG